MEEEDGMNDLYINVVMWRQPERGGREDQGEDKQKWSGEVKVEDGCLTPPGFCHKGTEQRNEA